MPTFPSTAHLEQLRNSQRSLNNALQLIDAAEACGIDCQEYRQGHQALSQQTSALIGRFFPDKVVGDNGSGVPNHGG